eukprot:8009770-Pyramimonas_sp.AAC.1
MPRGIGTVDMYIGQWGLGDLGRIGTRIGTEGQGSSKLGAAGEEGQVPGAVGTRPQGHDY